MQRRRLVNPYNRRDRVMRLNGLAWIILVMIVLLIITPLSTYDPVSCTVINAGVEQVNGYYVGLSGIYYKRGIPVLLMPDYFDLLSLRQYISAISTITMTEEHWQISTNNQQIIQYMSTQTNQVDSPPSTNWKVEKDGISPAPSIIQTHGSLQNSPDLPNYSRDSNLQSLYHRPINTIILGIIFYIFFLCVTNAIDKNALVISYDSIINKEEYWRIFSASLSHFDWMHVIFNTMSLYQIGELEIIIGSGQYLYLSVDLIVITMLICLGIQHILITCMERTEMILQQSLGYSCVLFAWMVVFSVRLRKFCPIFLFPSLCFSTYSIQFPFLPSVGFPVNFGPIVLLLFTKILLPQSSFLGHLSGIIIGYPLAWNMLNWFTPPLLFGLIGATIIYKQNLYIWNISNFESARTTETFQEFVPFLQYLWMQILTGITIGVTVLYIFVIFFFGWKQGLLRICVLFLCWSSIYAIRCCWLSDQSIIIKPCGDIILTSFILTLFTLLLDIATFGGILGSRLLLSNVVTIAAYIPYSIFVTISLLSILSESMLCIGLWYGLRDLRVCAAWLESLRLDSMSIDHDMNLLGIRYVLSLIRRVQDWLTPQIGHRLGYTHSRLPLDEPTEVIRMISIPSTENSNSSNNNQGYQGTSTKDSKSHNSSIVML